MIRSAIRGFAVLAIVAAGAPAFGQGADLTLEQKETFLKTAKIIKERHLSEGITGSLRATLSDGRLTHDAQIQTIDEFKPIYTTAFGTELNFRDTYNGNIAAYRLDRILNLNMIPPSVERKVGGKTAAVTWWIDNTLMTEKQRFFKKMEPPDPDMWNRQMYIVRVFDQLIYNTDRNLGNLIITKDWKLKMIDHTRAFRLYKDLRNPENLTHCDRRLFEELKKLDLDTLNRELRPYLTNGEIKAILARRDRIVKLFEKKIAESGESAVLYDYLSLQGTSK